MKKIFILLFFLIILAFSVKGNVFLKGGDGFTGVQPPYLYNIGLTIFFNESELNTTIDARVVGGSKWNFVRRYIANNSLDAWINESELNRTIDLRENDTLYTSDEIYINLTQSNQFRFNETNLNITITSIHNSLGDGSGGGKSGIAPWLYNDSDEMFWNESTGNETYLRLDGTFPMNGTLTVGSIKSTNGFLNITSNLNMRQNNISNIRELVAPDQSVIGFGTNPRFNIFSGMLQAIAIGNNQTLSDGVITHIFLDINKGKVIAAWQSGKNDSWQYTRNSGGYFNDSGITNVSDLSNANFMWNNIGITPGLDYYSSQIGADLGVEHGIETRVIITHDELGDGRIESRGEFRHIARDGTDIDLYEGDVHIVDEHLEEVGNIPGDLVFILNEDFSDGNLDPFFKITTTNGINDWAAVSNVDCYDGICARARGTSPQTEVIMELNRSTLDLDNCNMSFRLNTTGLDSTDLFNVTVWNNTATSENFTVFNITDGVDINGLVERDLPINMDNVSVITFRWRFTANNPSQEIIYVDNVNILCESTDDTLTNVTRQDAKIEFGDGSCMIEMWDLDRNAINITCADINFIGNATFVNQNIVSTNATGNIEGDSLIARFDSNSTTFYGNDIFIDGINLTELINAVNDSHINESVRIKTLEDNLISNATQQIADNLTQADLINGLISSNSSQKLYLDLLNASQINLNSSLTIIISSLQYVNLTEIANNNTQWAQIQLKANLTDIPTNESILSLVNESTLRLNTSRIDFPDVDVSIVNGTNTWIKLVSISEDHTDDASRNFNVYNFLARNLIELSGQAKLIFGYTATDKFMRYNSGTDKLQMITDDIEFELINTSLNLDNRTLKVQDGSGHFLKMNCTTDDGCFMDFDWSTAASKDFVIRTKDGSNIQTERMIFKNYADRTDIDIINANLDMNTGNVSNAEHITATGDINTTGEVCSNDICLTNVDTNETDRVEGDNNTQALQIDNLNSSLVIQIDRIDNHNSSLVQHTGQIDNLNSSIITRLANHTSINVTSILSIDWTNITITISQISNLPGNETTRFGTLIGTNCGGTDKMIGVDADGLVECDTDQTGGGGADMVWDTVGSPFISNQSGLLIFNETVGNWTYININGTTGNLSILTNLTVDSWIFTTNLNVSKHANIENISAMNLTASDTVMTELIRHLDGTGFWDTLNCANGIKTITASGSGTCAIVPTDPNVFNWFYDPDNSNFFQPNVAQSRMGFAEPGIPGTSRRYIKIDARNTGGLRGQYLNISIDESAPKRCSTITCGENTALSSGYQWSCGGNGEAGANLDVLPMINGTIEGIGLSCTTSTGTAVVEVYKNNVATGCSVTSTGANDIQLCTPIAIVQTDGMQPFTVSDTGHANCVATIKICQDW